MVTQETMFYIYYEKLLFLSFQSYKRFIH